MQTGAGQAMGSPVGVSWPVLGSTRKMLIVLESWLAAKRYWPVGSMAKLRGVLPPVAWKPTSVSLPEAGSAE